MLLQQIAMLTPFTPILLVCSINSYNLYLRSNHGNNIPLIHCFCGQVQSDFVTLKANCLTLFFVFSPHLMPLSEILELGSKTIQKQLRSVLVYMYLQIGFKVVDNNKTKLYVNSAGDLLVELEGSVAHFSTLRCNSSY